MGINLFSTLQSHLNTHSPLISFTIQLCDHTIPCFILLLVCTHYLFECCQKGEKHQLCINWKFCHHKKGRECWVLILENVGLQQVLKCFWWWAILIDVMWNVHKWYVCFWWWTFHEQDKIDVLWMCETWWEWQLDANETHVLYVHYISLIMSFNVGEIPCKTKPKIQVQKNKTSCWNSAPVNRWIVHLSTDE